MLSFGGNACENVESKLSDILSWLQCTAVVLLMEGYMYICILCVCIFVKIARKWTRQSHVHPWSSVRKSVRTSFWIQWPFIWDRTSTPIHARAWKEKALVGYISQQIPTNNNIHKMLIIIISLRWKHFVIKSYLYKIPTINEPYNQRKRDIR